jgi:hypothetical protein
MVWRYQYACLVADMLVRLTPSDKAPQYRKQRCRLTCVDGLNKYDSVRFYDLDEDEVCSPIAVPAFMLVFSL